ncbi:hypothetical protein MPH47_09775 [Psychrobacillus psychrodurans]|uniref:hypothetical protein n=1 Tax=Psychrobacillus psychrodurans TaxID=126157 RepID=UPI001F4EE79B|nr:hypothetical protein [Psychrobacillus psychrodurans]MCK1997505.1 hypothetical protein [Psychrobacillus psychrodurans]
MIVQSLYATKTFKMILEFDKEYRIWDIKKFGNTNNILLNEVSNNIEMFMSVNIDEESGNISWKNGFRVDFNTIFDQSKDLEQILNSPPKLRHWAVASKTTKFEGTLKIVRENRELLDKIKSLRN